MRIDVLLHEKSKEQIVCIIILAFVLNYICAYIFINTQNISGNIFKKLMRAVAVREDSWYLGNEEVVKGDLLTTINTRNLSRLCHVHVFLIKMTINQLISENKTKWWGLTYQVGVSTVG